MFCASVNGSLPAMDTVRRPPGPAAVPSRMAWTPAALGDPVGASAARACAVSCGISPLSVSSSGARSGAAISTAPASAPRQSRTSASATAPGRWAAALPGKTMRAVAAAVPTLSAVLTRVVFFVARAGYAAGAAVGAAADPPVVVAPTVGVPCVPPCPQAPSASTRTHAPASAATGRRRAGGIACEGNPIRRSWSLRRQSSVQLRSARPNPHQWGSGDPDVWGESRGHP